MPRGLYVKRERKFTSEKEANFGRPKFVHRQAEVCRPLQL